MINIHNNFVIFSVYAGVWRVFGNKFSNAFTRSHLHFGFAWAAFRPDSQV